MNKAIKRMFRASVFLSVVSLIFGIILLLDTKTILTTISNILGGSLLILGIITTINYFIDKSFIKSLEDNLQLGIILTILGLVLLIFKNILYITIPLIIGIIVLINSINKMDLAFVMKKDGLKKWYISLVASIITLIISICLIVNPLGGTFLVTKIVGLLITISSLIDLIDTLNLKIQIKKTGKKLKEIFSKE